MGQNHTLHKRIYHQNNTFEAILLLNFTINIVCANGLSFSTPCDNPTRNHAELAIIASWVTQLGIISSSVVPTSNC